MPPQWRRLLSVLLQGHLTKKALVMDTALPSRPGKGSLAVGRNPPRILQGGMGLVCKKPPRIPKGSLLFRLPVPLTPIYSLYRLPIATQSPTAAPKPIAPHFGSLPPIYRSSARIGSAVSTFKVGSTPTTSLNTCLRVSAATATLDWGTIMPSYIEKLGMRCSRISIMIVPITA